MKILKIEKPRIEKGMLKCCRMF